MKNSLSVLLFCVFASTMQGQELTVREKRLLDQVERLEARVAALEKKLEPAVSSVTASPVAIPEAVERAKQSPTAGFNYGLTLDGYYAYNFNHPGNRTNALRAYDVSSNSFSLNQATFVIERPVDLTVGRRYGARVDLQYGQATQTLQGSSTNELRPDIYRTVFQAYGTYVAPIGSGLTVDFGKWASSLGIENNYTKDQANYSRSYLFTYLPYYHMGLRSTYAFNDKVNVSWWLVNGAQQTEDFNGFKSNAVLLNVKPTKAVSWNLNYYFGDENRVAGAHGKTHILDSYVSWNATKDLTFGAEGDYVVSRETPGSAPSRVTAGALYFRQQLKRDFAIAARGEYLSDRGGLFSGGTQALKEATLTFEKKLAEGLLVRSEWRRDFSNRNYFPTANAGVLRRSQSTATVGLVWWFGNKEGAW